MHAIIAAAVTIILTTIGTGAIYSAIIGDTTELNLPSTFVKPITRPRYCDEKY